MSWTTPKTWQLNEILTSSDMNTYVSDNMTHLKDNILADYVRLSHTVASGTNGGIGTTGSWQTRPINTEDSDAGGVCTLSGNEFTLAAGTYYVKAIANFLSTTQSQIRIYDVTNTAVSALGVNVFARAISVVHQTAYVAGYVTSAGSTTFRIEYRVSATGGTDALGIATSWGDEVYAIVEMWRVAK